MKDEVLAHLHDVVQAGKALKRFVDGRTFADYTSDEELRSAVERKLEIMGEALNRIHRDDPALLRHIRDHRDIISFRSILVHGHDTIDDVIVWSVIEEGLHNLIDDAEALLPATND